MSPAHDSRTLNYVFSILRYCIALSVMFVTGTLVRAQEEDLRPVGIISGQILNAATRTPISGASVSVEGTTRGAVSRQDGKFRIVNVQAGVVALRARALGYDSARISDVVVSPGKPVEILITLTERALEAEEAVVYANPFARNSQTVTSTQRLTSEEVRRAPGVQEDVVRAISLLPGVAVTSAGRNDLAVRGGAPFENLFLVDNIEVPNINHFGSQGSTGGPLSLINIDLVRDVSLSTGGFGPRYGDRLSSVTNLSLRDGNSEQLGGELNLSATGFSAILEGPISNKGTFIFAARRSYLDLIFNLAGFGFVPEYWDFTGKATYTIDNENSLSFLAIGALGTVSFNNDDAEKRFDNSRVTAPSQNQYFSGLTWQRLLDNGYLLVTLGRTFTAYRTAQQDTTGATIFRNNSDEGENSLRADLTLRASSTVDVTTGAIGRFTSALRYDVSLPGFARLNASGIPTPLSVDTSFTAFRAGVYANLDWKFADRWKLTIGGRYDYYGFLTESSVVSPRFALAWSFIPDMTLSMSGGRYYQPPQFIWLIGDPANASSLQPLRADQIVAGWEWIVSPDFKVQVEGYYKNYANYPVRLFRPQAVLAPSGFDNIYQDIPFGLEPLAMTGSGTAYGVELFVQKKLSEDIPIYGLASISINRTRFIANDGVERPGSFDTPIIGSVAMGWRPDEYWEISGKVRLSQGIPTTPFVATTERATETGFPVGSLDFARYNLGERLPFFYAIDLRVDRRWFFTGWQLITYIDVQNVTGRQNASGIQWDPRTETAVTNFSIGVLPSIGVNIEF